jgi:hypothetical protein
VAALSFRTAPHGREAAAAPVSPRAAVPYHVRGMKKRREEGDTCGR